jgi:hypothetical protein
MPAIGSPAHLESVSFSAMGEHHDASARTGRPALSIGAVLGDCDARSTAWKHAISELGKEVMAHRQGPDSPLRLNVVFHVDGRLVPNDFTGVRTGRFSAKDALLMVQAAVPLEPDDDRGAVLLRLLEESVHEAEAWARRRRIAESLPVIRRLLARVSSP